MRTERSYLASRKKMTNYWESGDAVNAYLMPLFLWYFSVKLTEYGITIQDIIILNLTDNEIFYFALGIYDSWFTRVMRYHGVIGFTSDFFFFNCVIYRIMRRVLMKPIIKIYLYNKKCVTKKRSRKNCRKFAKQDSILIQNLLYKIIYIISS